MHAFIIVTYSENRKNNLLSWIGTLIFSIFIPWDNHGYSVTKKIYRILTCQTIVIFSHFYTSMDWFMNKTVDSTTSVITQWVMCRKPSKPWNVIDFVLKLIKMPKILIINMMLFCQKGAFGCLQIQSQLGFSIYSWKLFENMARFWETDTGCCNTIFIQYWWSSFFSQQPIEHDTSGASCVNWRLMHYTDIGFHSSNEFLAHSGQTTFSEVFHVRKATFFTAEFSSRGKKAF